MITHMIGRNTRYGKATAPTSNGRHDQWISFSPPR